MAAASASTSVSTELIDFPWTGAGVLADVRAWHAASMANFGWIVIGDESIDRTNRQFHSRESQTVGAAPTLRVTYFDQRPVGIEREPGGGYRVRFVGVPGRTYTIQFAPVLVPPDWRPIGSGTADIHGAFSFLDTPPDGTTARFYRIVHP